jgi:predicted nucleotidyltransferase
LQIVEKNIEKIRCLCEKHKVSELFVFGSVITEKFNPESDIDFLVDFDSMNVFDYAENYFDLKFALEDILDRKVDLLELKAIKNPFLKQSIDATKIMIYGQRDKNLVV